MNRRILAAAAGALVLLLGTAGTPAQAGGRHDGFVTRSGSDLKLDGKPFRFAGSNNYYLMYSSQAMVDDVFARAQVSGQTVLRTWGWLDIGNADDTGSVSGKKNGVYFQYWDGAKPAYNDGPDGLQRLDYVIWKAGRSGVKLIIPFTNNWSDFGGIDQYVRWAGADNHDDFYTDPVIRGWYRDWITHLLTRVNPLTGLAYRDDPTIMMWELGNEPRCKGSGLYPPSAQCTPATLTTWADEMTRHVKSVDRRHLAGVGDEGFYCDDATSADWTVNCGEGVDSNALARLAAVDVVSYHLYPDGWGNRTAQWGTDWIARHTRDAKLAGKPVMAGEFGWREKASRNPTYQAWTGAASRDGGDGFLYWMLNGVQDDGTMYPDYDGFTVACPSPVCQTITNAGKIISSGVRTFPPVADHDTAVVPYGEAATLSPAANDIAYQTHVRADRIDLDPAVDGRQTGRTVTGGTFALDAAGVVTFTPEQGWSGKATVSYTIRDTAARLSNPADITVTVLPDPTAAIPLASFETGVDGWAAGSWQANAGTLSPQTAFVTDGAAGLHADGADGGWFGVSFPAAVDLSGKSYVKYDLRTYAAGTSTSIVLQAGPSWTWCQGPFNWVNQDTARSIVEVDLHSGLSCDPSLLNEVHAIYLWISPGSFDLDHVRAE
ncbi:cellulase family glycosylhydrolase [Catellatospora sp. KI3]|uniref:cellulase family glycosylhydrolase n=1 Tax=Catellatospora sp. KI3 TaxID=3041620 RepID=UPI002482FCB1|nr:cellulase family glycosylhydrolase [Catellatospora sp. KI3]MDI1464421.1 cellulase family glycosylhydrolase [Catellatospora sp. KI3]